MGLCASQARLLTLTAQKSDLELQAQLISHARMVLAQNQQTIAEEYAEKTSNKKLQIRLMDEEGASAKTVNLTPETLTQAGYGILYNGKVYATKKDIEEAICGTYINEDGEPVAKKGNLYDVGVDNNLLQNLISTGRATIVEIDSYEDDNVTPKTWTEYSLGGTNDIYDNYYTEDDAAAKAQYDTAMTKLQAKDKRLELDLDQVETQHNAIQTEIESVEKIVSSNIEKSYKIFADS